MIACMYGCNRQFQSLAHLKDHKDAFHANMMMKCRYGCDRLFKTLGAMTSHRADFHDSGISGTALVASRPTKKKSVTACNDCGKSFSSVDALRQHQNTQADHIRPAKEAGSYECEVCLKTLRSPDSLEQHFVDEHSLKQLAEGDSVRTKLSREFLENWRKPSTPGHILTVFKIYNPGWRVFTFKQYRAPLQNNGNEVERYHGTSLLCDLGGNLGKGKNDSKLCHLEGCNLCGILRSGFKTAKAKSGWQRFGKGIYTTATSGKANDYIKSNSSRRAVLVCRVLAGNVYRTEKNMPDLEAPPVGYDSVSGEVGINLNYDETVVYCRKAILPAYMIVYTT